MSSNWLNQVKWDSDGLVATVAQDYQTGRILMLAWVNEVALKLASEENRAIYWSRSRKRLWRKGEESGHIQKLHGIFLDCDGDALIYQVEQLGGIACHTGRESCFYQKLSDDSWQTIEPVIKDPKDIYS